MSKLVFRCPYTNKRLLSGIEIDRDSARRIQELPLRVHCPHCGLHHDGVISDGELSDAVLNVGTHRSSPQSNTTTFPL